MLECWVRIFTLSIQLSCLLIWRTGKKYIYLFGDNLYFCYFFRTTSLHCELCSGIKLDCSLWPKMQRRGKTAESNCPVQCEILPCQVSSLTIHNFPRSFRFYYKLVRNYIFHFYKHNKTVQMGPRSMVILQWKLWRGGTEKSVNLWTTRVAKFNSASSRRSLFGPKARIEKTMYHPTVS